MKKKKKRRPLTYTLYFSVFDIEANQREQAFYELKTRLNDVCVSLGDIISCTFANCSGAFTDLPDDFYKTVSGSGG